MDLWGRTSLLQREGSFSRSTGPQPQPASYSGCHFEGLASGRHSTTKGLSCLRASHRTVLNLLANWSELLDKISSFEKPIFEISNRTIAASLFRVKRGCSGTG